MKNAKIVIPIIGLTCLIGLTYAGYSYYLSGISIPRPIAKQVKFDIFYPEDKKTYPVPKKTISFAADTKVLSYTTSVHGTKVVVNEQAEPEVFHEADAQVSLYEKLLDKMHQYKEIETDIGKVTLTRPEELKGGQAAVMDERGTLLFAQPDRELSDADWSRFFNSLNKL